MTQEKLNNALETGTRVGLFVGVTAYAGWMISAFGGWMKDAIQNAKDKRKQRIYTEAYDKAKADYEKRIEELRWENEQLIQKCYKESEGAE